MTPEFLLDFTREAVKTGILLAAPLLFSGMLVGLLVAIFRAVTQINEITLTFIPKILMIILSLVFFAPWMLQLITGFTTNIMGNFAEFIK